MRMRLTLQVNLEEVPDDRGSLDVTAFILTQALIDFVRNRGASIVGSEYSIDGEECVPVALVDELEGDEPSL